MINSAGFDKALSNNIMLAALFVLMIIQPIFGLIGDKIGHKNSLLIYAVLAFLGIYPLFMLLKISADTPLLAFCSILALFVILSFYTSVAGIFKAKLFPEHIRALGTGLSYAVANAIFGGSAPFVALQFKNYGFENFFFVYVAAMMIFVFFVVLLLPKKALLD